MYARRLLAGVALSLLVHLLLAGGMARLPDKAPPPRPSAVTVRLVRTPKPEPEPPPPEPTPPPPEPLEMPPPEPAPPPIAALEPQPPPRRPARRPARRPTSARTQNTTAGAASERVTTGDDTTSTPVFGLTMESTSQAGSGPAVPVGNTLQGPAGPRATPGKAKPLAGPPVAAYQVTKMPLPKGRCTGRYTEEARAAGVEDSVVLNLVVGEDGRARDIEVVQGLDHGLNAAAIKAVKACRFTPGERAGQPVPVRIRAFKIRFFMQDAE